MRELVAFMIIVALIVQFIWWILGVAAVIALYFVVRSIIRSERAHRQAIALRETEIAARADEQHRWVLDGDDRGIYGQYPVPDIVDDPSHGKD